VPAILPCTLSSYSVLFSVADWGPCLWSGSWADERSGTDEPWYLDRKQSRQHRTTGSGADEDRTAAETTDNTTSTRVPVGGCSWSERRRIGELLPVGLPVGGGYWSWRGGASEIYFRLASSRLLLSSSSSLVPRCRRLPWFDSCKVLLPTTFPSSTTARW